jgi:endo-1,4-beta-xylanase
MKMKFYMLLALILVTISLAFMLWTMPSGLLASMPATSDTLVPQSTYPPRSVEATTTPEPSRPYELYLPLVLKKAWTVKLMVYPGPSNVDYGPGVELPQGTELTPLGRYVDFVKVQWTDEGRVLHEGFVWAALLGELPQGLPELSKYEVPWVEIFTHEGPQTLRSENPEEYNHHPTGAAFVWDEELNIQVAMSIIYADGAPIDAANGLDLTTGGNRQGEDLRELYFAYNPEWRFWDLSFYVGNELQYWKVIFENAQPEGRFSIKISRDGEAVTVVNCEDGEQQSFRLPQSVDGDDKYLTVLFLTAPHSELTVSELAISQAPTGAWVQPPQSLHNLAKVHRISFGTVVDYHPLFFEPQYQLTYLEQFGPMTVTVDWPSANPEPGVYVWAQMDKIMEFADQHNRPVLLAHLFFPSRLPDWIYDPSLTDDQLIDAIRNFFREVLLRYQGKVETVIVANEAHPIDDHGDNPFLNRFGPQYLEWLFQWAREFCPTCDLMYNDHMIETRNGKSDAVYAMIKDFKARGVPIDVVGFQAHEFDAANPPGVEELVENLARFAELGVDVEFTEVFVDVGNLPDSLSEEEKFERQADVYEAIVRACLTVNQRLGRQACRGIRVWGVDDGHAWAGPTGEIQTPLLFTSNYETKPAYERIIFVLSR